MLAAAPGGNDGRSASSARGTADVLGIVAAIVGLSALLASVRQPIMGYDEGLVLTYATLLLRGEVPHRDFYSVYPPGIYYLVAGLWSALGVSVVKARLLGVAVLTSIALLAGRLAGLALLATARLAGAPNGGGRARYLVAGGVVGLLSFVRHDLFAYLAAAFGALALFGALARRRAPATPASAAAWLGAGAALAVAALWLPTLARAGPVLVVTDLCIEVMHQLPARVLPMPALDAMVRGLGGVEMPVVLARPFEGGVALTLLAPVLALLALRVTGGCAEGRRRAVALIGALSCAVLPQVLGRTDLPHALYTVTPGIVLGVVLAERLAARAGTAGGIAVVSAVALVLAGPVVADVVRQLRTPRHRSESRASRATTGCRNGRRRRPPRAARSSPSSPSTRPPGTRYMQLDPNVVTRPDVQRRMIADLERRAVRVAVLADHLRADEPNESRDLGADLLDAYLRDRYQEAAVAGPYRLLLRRPTSPP